MIGVGIITCDRPDFFKQCLDSLDEAVINRLVVVDDGDTPVLVRPSTGNGYLEHIIRHEPGRQGVGKSKAHAIDWLYNQGCEHIFLIEDDIIVTDPTVFVRYIDAAEVTGIKHFMYGYHGPANKKGGSHGTPNPKYVINYGNDVAVVINEHCVGAFCYYHKDCIDAVGNMDLEYHNAFEHIDHSYMIYKAGLTTPYWNWADIDKSWEYLDEIACSEENSSIRGNPDWEKNISHGYRRFKEKHGYTPFAQGCVPRTSEEELTKVMREIYEKHSTRD